MGNHQQSFAEHVYTLTRQIPRGKVSTYKSIATALGTKAYRAVGQALHCNPDAPVVPCHRVIASNGHLRGFAHGLPEKKRMLEREGVSIVEDVVDMKLHFYAVKKRKRR